MNDTRLVERVALITALVLDRPVCLDCLTVDARLSLEEIVATVEQIGRALTVHHGYRRCCVCAAYAQIVAATRPPT